MSKKPTYAKASEKLARKRKKYEKLAESEDPAEKNTGKRMLQRIDNTLEELYQEQQSKNGNNGSNTGGISEFAEGGNINDLDPNLGMQELIDSGLLDTEESLDPEDDYLDPNLGMKELINSGLLDTEEPTTPGSYEDPFGMDPLTMEDVGPIDNIDFEGNKELAPSSLLENGKEELDKAELYKRLASGVVESTLPFADNLYNRKMINEMEGPVAPREMNRYRSIDLNDDLNIASQVNAAEEGYQEFAQGVNDTMADPQVANAMKLKALDNRNKQLGELYGQQENYSNEINNMESKLNNRTANRNVDLDNMYNRLMTQFEQSQVDFENARKQAKSKNVSDAVADGQQLMKDRAKRRLDRDKLKILMPYLNRNGVVDRNLKDLLEQMNYEYTGKEKSK